MSTFSLFFCWNLHFLFTFLLKCVLSLYFSIEISTFSLLFYWNLYFLFTFLLKPLLSLYFSIGISTFSTFLLKSLLSLYFSILYFLFTFLLKSLLSLYFSIGISTFHFILKPLLSFYFSLRTQEFQGKAMPSLPRSPAPALRRDLPQRVSHTTSFSRPRALWFTVKTQGFARFLAFKLAHCRTPATLTATSWLSYLMTVLFNCELPLDYSNSWLIQLFVTTEVSN